MREKLQVAVGDTVIVTSQHNRGVTVRKCTVTAIGRKYVYVTGYGPNYGFDLVTGRGNSGHGHTHVLHTQTSWAESQRHEEVVRRLRTDHNIAAAQGHRLSQDTDTLQAVLDLLVSRAEEIDRG